MTRKDAEADFTARVLAVHLRNRATYTQWFDEMVKVTPPKTDRKTGEMKPGISESKFRGLRKVLLEQGRVTRLTVGQGSIYTVVSGASGGADVANVDEVVVVVREHRAPHRAAEPTQSATETESLIPSGDDLIAQVHAQLGKRPRWDKVGQ
jgi:hypothetical protein